MVQHEAIAMHYVDVIARAIQEYHTDIVVNDNDDPLQLYKDLAWGGLQETVIFNELHPQLSESRIRIQDKLWAEQLNINFGEAEPSGEPCN